MLEVKNLHKDFGGIKAVNGTSFVVPEGKITALIGPNGAGKTTVFNMVMGFMKIDRGRIVFDGTDITHFPPHKRFRAGMATTFQMVRLFGKMSVMENLMVGMNDRNESLGHALLQSRLMKHQERELVKDARKWLEFVQLDVKESVLAKNLSYGQSKLVEIARALASRPRLLLLDEPASGVNPTLLKKIEGMIRKLRDQGTTVLLVEHNMECVMGLADKVVVLDYGKEIAEGTPKEIKKNKRVIDAYLGRVQ